MHLLPLLLSAALPTATAAGGYGMTWALSSHDSSYGVDVVHCIAGGDTCDAYSGDTACTEKLPILCIAVDGSSNPGALTTTYTRWADGHIAPTRPVKGTNLGSVAEGDAICQIHFGSDWRMAEFHDGWGWGFTAFGHVRDDTRFWVYIDDQPANCWD